LFAVISLASWDKRRCCQYGPAVIGIKTSGTLPIVAGSIACTGAVSEVSGDHFTVNAVRCEKPGHHSKHAHPNVNRCNALF